MFDAFAAQPPRRRYFTLTVLLIERLSILFLQLQKCDRNNAVNKNCTHLGTKVTLSVFRVYNVNIGITSTKIFYWIIKYNFTLSL